jgi:hypothetical protein
MPIYMEISRLHRTVTIVARGDVDIEEIRGVAVKLAEAKVRSFAKILEVAGAKSNMTMAHVEQVAAVMRGASEEKRGPVAFVLNHSQVPLTEAFAERTKSEGPVGLFSSLREARKWTEQILAATAYGQPASTPAGQTAFTDPGREGVMLKGSRQREVTVRSLETA